MSKSKWHRARSGASRPSKYAKEIRDLGTLKVPKELKIGTNTRYVYWGQCFWRSFEYAFHEARYSMPGVWLVQGECNLVSGGHAWVELPNGLVFDAVYQRWFSNYYGPDGQNARAFYKFTPEAAIAIYEELNADLKEGELAVYRFDHPMCLPWGDSKNPLLIDHDKALELIRDRPGKLAERRGQFERFEKERNAKLEGAVSLDA